MKQLKKITGTLDITDEEYETIVNFSEANKMGFNEIISRCVKYCISQNFSKLMTIKENENL